MSKKTYLRKLVVRAIEDACVLLMMGVGTAVICHGVSLVFKILNII
jgi:hypothetical protein